jgi:hypothetical protein
MSNKYIVTRGFIAEKLASDNAELVMHFIGRALVALLDRQTADEKQSATTNHTNYRGFAQNDAKSGTLSAKYYLKHGKLESWQINAWTRPWKGMPRLCKYWLQLDEVAKAKAAKKEQNDG